MDIWLSELNELFRMLFGRSSALEMWLVVGLCLLVSLLLFKKLAEWMGGKEQFMWKTSILLIVGVALMAAVAAAIATFINGTWLLQAIAAGVLLLVLIIPMGLRILKVSYLTSVMIWAFTALAIAVILFVEPMVMDSIHRGGKSASGLKLRRIEAEGILK